MNVSVQLSLMRMSKPGKAAALSTERLHIEKSSKIRSVDGFSELRALKAIIDTRPPNLHVDLKGQFNTTDVVIGDETTRHAIPMARHVCRSTHERECP